MMEYWNNVLKTYNFRVRIKVLGINFHYLSMNIFIGFGDNHSFMAIINHNFLQCDGKKTQHSSISLFHHSNCERSELT